MSNPAQTDDRTIRVFVSSTFRDMQAERDELVLRIFPQLRRLCEQRGVTWGEIDLRWGITEEQSQRGQVLPICLEEIKRCRPYFIGLLGERYGWIPEVIPAEVLEREPWIRGHTDGADKKSVTELEILHGVLNDPKMEDHAFFYFRDPGYADTVPSESRKDFITEGAESTDKLKRLKEEVRRKHRDAKLKYQPRENYRDAKSLGQLVLADFVALIDSLYPPGGQPSPLERERMDHEAFARSRAGVYIGRQEYFDGLDAHVASDEGPLVVLGESGSGKSALLANWALGYRKRHPDDFLLLHFIGASPDSANAIAMLRRIMLELKQRFDLTDDVPAQPEKIRKEFPDWLAKVAGRGRIVLVLDALNQLEDVGGAPDLGWLPRTFPKYCSVIISTLPGRSLTAMEQRGGLEATPPMKVQPLDEGERRRLIHEFLRQHTRDLGPARTDRIVSAPQTTNPLYLRVLLDELRVFGLHEKLNDRIDWYLEAKDPYQLYRKVIARWEQAYAEGTDLVRDTLSLLWAARRGLSETEMLESLGQQDRPLPRAIWSPLFLAMSHALVSRSGLWTFAHNFLRTAARDTYLPDEAGQQAAHRRLAEYFRQLSTWGDRKLDELPWQLAAARDWKPLHDVLTEAGCFLGLRQRNQYEVLGYWVQLKPPVDIATSFASAFARWSQGQSDGFELGVVASHLGLFLQEAASHAAAEPLMRNALTIIERSWGADHPEFAIALNNLALLLKDTNRLTEAEPLMRRALAIDERTLGTDHPNLATKLISLARLLTKTNRLAEAEPLIRHALAIDERFHGANHPLMGRDLSDLGGLLDASKRFAEAEPAHRRALAIAEQSFGADHPDVAACLNNLAGLLANTNRLEQAEPLYRRALAISESSFGVEHPEVAIQLNNLALLLQTTNRATEAEPLYHRALAIAERSFGTDHPTVATKLNNLALLLCKSNRLAEAEPLVRRALEIAERSLGADHPTVALYLRNLAEMLYAANRLSEAEPPLRRMLEILMKATRAAGHLHADLPAASANYGILLEAMGMSHADIRQRLNDLGGRYGMALA